jgi:hypothetical protein
MNTRKWDRITLALICLTLTLALSTANEKASPTLQGETDFAAIDTYVAEQVKNLGILVSMMGIVEVTSVGMFGGGHSGWGRLLRATRPACWLWVGWMRQMRGPRRCSGMGRHTTVDKALIRRPRWSYR